MSPPRADPALVMRATSSLELYSAPYRAQNIEKKMIKQRICYQRWRRRRLRGVVVGPIASCFFLARPRGLRRTCVVGPGGEIGWTQFQPVRQVAKSLWEIAERSSGGRDLGWLSGWRQSAAQSAV